MRSLLCSLLVLPLVAWADAGLPTQPYVYVEGKASVEKPADMVTIRFALSSLNLDQSLANKQVQAQAAKIFALLKGTEIADADVTASDISSEEEREEEPETPVNGAAGSDRKGKLLGFRVTRPFSVKVRNLTRLPKLIEDLLALKIHEFSGITEGLTTEKELEDEVWEKAVVNARERAEKTVKATGGKVGSVFAISPVTFPQILPNIFGDSRQYETMKEVLPNKAAEPSTYRLSPVSVSQRVHIIYLLDDK